jgi:hypothetical protein
MKKKLTLALVLISSIAFAQVDTLGVKINTAQSAQIEAFERARQEFERQYNTYLKAIYDQNGINADSVSVVALMPKRLILMKRKPN